MPAPKQRKHKTRILLAIGMPELQSSEQTFVNQMSTQSFHNFQIFFLSAIYLAFLV